MTAVRLLLGFSVAVLLSGCAADDSPAPPSPAASTTEAPAATTVEPAPGGPPAPTPEPVPEEPVVVEEPYIVDCQTGLGPIVTSWSDRTVTGYSDYCQSIHDEVLQGEVEANAPACDGTTCRYPSGATIPDPNAVPQQEVPDDRCTNQIDYAGDPRSNAEINSIGAETGQCPEPIS